MRMLIIEDQPEFIASVIEAFRKVDQTVELETPDTTGLAEKFDDSGTASLEEQMLAKMKALHESKPIDLVLLDTDLSRLGNGVTQSLCRQTFQELGVPVCRYRKRMSTTDIARLQDLHRLAREGASAVWVPSEYAQAGRLETKFVPWLLAIAKGFAALQSSVNADPDLLAKPVGPAGILATVLRHPSLKADLLGYTAQNFFFFGPPTGEDGDNPTMPANSAAQATRLGYWLVNYILRFPGPILSREAAAAYLNLKLESFDHQIVQELIDGAKYREAFSEIDQYYWRDDLAELLDKFDGDIATAPQLNRAGLERVDIENLGASAYLCLLTQEPIGADDAAPKPDWIPTGAQLARIKRDLYEQLGPLLSI